MELRALSIRLRALTVFRSLLSDPVLESVCTYLDCLENEWQQGVISGYAELVSRLYKTEEGDLGRHILRIVEESDNVYIRMIGQGGTPPAYMSQCVASELETLQAAASLTPDRLRDGLDGVDFLPEFGTERVDLMEAYRRRTADVGRYGWGIYARRHMFYLEGRQIIPVHHPDTIRLSDLAGYQRERNAVLENTKALLESRPAANMLLTGDAGTGKSSTIKAVVNELYSEGLRIIEIRKDQLRDLPAVLDELSANPLKFILFIDDLSFQRGDDNYSSLKAVLEGSVSAKSRNVAIYATSNRRHLVKETFSDREGDDIHRGETMQEIVSLSERFGLHVTFQKPDKSAYLAIVRHLAERDRIVCPDLEIRAERFALERGGRSARAARQFVDNLAAAGFRNGDN